MAPGGMSNSRRYQVVNAPLGCFSSTLLSRRTGARQRESSKADRRGSTGDQAVDRGRGDVRGCGLGDRLLEEIDTASSREGWGPAAGIGCTDPVGLRGRRSCTLRRNERRREDMGSTSRCVGSQWPGRREVRGGKGLQRRGPVLLAQALEAAGGPRCGAGDDEDRKGDPRSRWSRWKRLIELAT